MINCVGCHFCHQTYQASLRVFRALFTASSLLRLPCEVQCCLVVHVLGIVIDARLGEQQREDLIMVWPCYSLQPTAYSYPKAHLNSRKASNFKTSSLTFGPLPCLKYAIGEYTLNH